MFLDAESKFVQNYLNILQLSKRINRIHVQVCMRMYVQVKLIYLQVPCNDAYKITNE